MSRGEEAMADCRGAAHGSPDAPCPVRSVQLTGYSVSRGRETDVDLRLREDAPRSGQSNLRRTHWSLDHIPAALWPLRRSR